jgi:Carboxypeptidase regulatory-like domain
MPYLRTVTRFPAVLFLVCSLLLGWCAVAPAPALPQTTSGSIQGTILDPQGAAVANARITVTSRANGQVKELATTGSGDFNFGTLSPGEYLIRVQAKGFRTVEATLTVQIGIVTPANFRLELGSESEVVAVEASAITINTDQATVQDVITSRQIEELPVDGRNFLDLAQLAPGVQIQDGSTFDPTKNGFSSISFGGRAGRTARIEVDGLDVSDETVGTTTQNIPVSAIQEFNLSQSSLDLSTELTSTGAVNIQTKTGTNNYHGDLYYYGRSDKTSAKITPPIAGLSAPEFGRNQYGGNFGGFLIKDKLFFFVDAERTGQTLESPVTSPAQIFSGFNGFFGSPFHETEYMGRLDYNIRGSWKAFFRFSYDQNLSVRGFNPDVYQPFANVDHTPSYAMGTDFVSGRFTHQFRVGYMKFRNAIADAVPTSGSPDPAPGIAIDITPLGVADLTCLNGGEDFCSGANILAPQATIQSNKQGKYDGTFTFGSHILRFGIGANRILGGGFAKFFGLAPIVNSTFNGGNQAVANGGPFSGGAGNPLNWPVENVLMGNGQGFFTELAQFGYPAGGQFDTRFNWYLGDSWKATRRLTITYGVHYVRDTGRSDADLAAIPELEQFGAGLGKQVHQPNRNFSPHLGIAWDPTGSGKTVIRAGGGIYYENAIFNNVLFDRPARLKQGLFFGTGLACLFGGPLDVPLPDGSSMTPTFCGQPIGSVASDIAAFQQQYQAAVVAAGAQANGSFVGSTLAEGANSTGDQLIAPSYRSPYSVQLNVGVQRQIARNTVVTVDYTRNVGLHYLLGVDTNRVGAARSLNVANAQAAVSTTNSAFGCGSGFDAAAINCAIAAGAQISDYAGNGLDSAVAVCAGFPCPGGAAFPGLNENVGENQMLFPIGRSVYNGVLASLKTDLINPVRGIHRLNLVVSYALSRFKSEAADQDFINNATDFDNPGRFFGPSGLDRTHNVSVGGVMDLPWATRIGMSAHWASAPPLTLLLPNSGAPGEIFRSDVTGDGTLGDVLPGTNIGSFGRSVKASDLNKVISAYNSSSAGQLTPAGQALVDSGLFSAAQLGAGDASCLDPAALAHSSLCAVMPALALAPSGQVGLSPRFTSDVYVAWELRVNKLLHGVSERVVVEPQIALFNVFNFQNFDPGGNIMSGVVQAACSPTPDCLGTGTVNTTTRGDRTNLVSPGSSSGVNWYGVPRQWQFGVKLIF